MSPGFGFITRNSTLGELCNLEALGSALESNSKRIYCRSDITD